MYIHIGADIDTNADTNIDIIVDIIIYIYTIWSRKVELDAFAKPHRWTPAAGPPQWPARRRGSHGTARSDPPRRSLGDVADFMLWMGQRNLAPADGWLKPYKMMRYII